MSATVNGIVEPVVVEVSSSDEPDSLTVLGGVQEVGSAVSTGAEYGSVVPVLGTLVGAVVGFFVGIGKSLEEAFSTTPDDARRFLYEIGYEPGKTLKTAKVLHDVSDRDKGAIRTARYLEISDRSNYGLDSVNGWLEKAGETAGRQSQNPMPQATYFAHMADAYIAAELGAILSRVTLKSEAPDIELPSPDAPLASEKQPLGRAVLRRLRDAEYLNGIRTAMEMLAPGRSDAIISTFGDWVGRVQLRASDTGVNPVHVDPVVIVRRKSVLHLGTGEWLAFGAAAAFVAGSAVVTRRSNVNKQNKAPKVGLAIGGVAAAGLLAWLFLGENKPHLQNSEAVPETPLTRQLSGRIGQGAVKDGRDVMVGPNGELVELVEGDLQKTRIAHGLVGHLVRIGGVFQVIQPDGSVKSQVDDPVGYSLALAKLGSK